MLPINDNLDKTMNEYTELKEYTLKDLGDGNGFCIRAETCAIYSSFETEEEKGKIMLTVETITHGALCLGDTEKFVMTSEEAEALVTALRGAIDDAQESEWELRNKELIKDLESLKPIEQ